MFIPFCSKKTYSLFQMEIICFLENYYNEFWNTNNRHVALFWVGVKIYFQKFGFFILIKLVLGLEFGMR